MTAWLNRLTDAESRFVPPPRQEVTPGNLCKGQLIGKGGYGLVYLCTHPSGSQFALKQQHKARLSRKSRGAEIALRELHAFQARGIEWIEDDNVLLADRIATNSAYPTLYLHKFWFFVKIDT